MNGCRPFLQRLGRWRNLAACLLAGAIAPITPSEAEPMRIRPLARDFLPGEIVRFEIVTGPEVVTVEGSFEGASLSLVRAHRTAADEVWSAWGVIPLDAIPGPAPYRFVARPTDGPPVESTGEIAVSAKTFPEQRLTVEPKFVNPPKAALARIERERKRLAAVYGRRTSIPPASSPFVRPVPGEPTSEFGTRRFFNGEPRTPHPGIDLHASTGTPVVSAGPGRVALASDLYYSGGTVIVDHGGGLFTVYAHLSKIRAKEGATLRAGDPVGLSGATGRVTGPHLHWGARVGEAIFDPRALLDPRLFADSETAGKEGLASR